MVFTNEALDPSLKGGGFFDRGVHRGDGDLGGGDRLIQNGCAHVVWVGVGKSGLRDACSEMM